MRFFFMMLMACMLVVGCGPIVDMDNDNVSIDAEHDTVEAPDLAVDIGYVTVVSATMEGVLFDQPVDQITVINGYSDDLDTRIELISEPSNGEDLVVMGASTFTGDLATDNLAETNSKNQGCGGTLIFQWTHDRPASFTVMETVREGDLIIVDYDMNFDNNEWLAGRYVLALN